MVVSKISCRLEPFRRKLAKHQMLQLRYITTSFLALVLEQSVHRVTNERYLETVDSGATVRRCVENKGNVTRCNSRRHDTDLSRYISTP